MVGSLKLKGKMSLSKFSIFVSIAIVAIVSSNLNWGKDHWKGIIEADGKGYYAYLPAIFIYKDLNFGFFEQIEKVKYYDKNLYYDYRSSSKGKTINKYYCGTAIVQLPFFLVAHLGSYILNYELDGYSKLYPVLINLAALFYLFIGLFYLNSILISYEISDKIRATTLFAAVFGTNLFYYAVIEPGMSHIYSFAFIAMFYFYLRRYLNTLEGKYIFILLLILSLIVLIRPINGLVLLILPFASNSAANLIHAFRSVIKSRLWLSMGFLAFLFMVSIQLILYKISTGSFFVYSYNEEGFDFFSPHIIDILFSYRKGLFLYTPLFLLAFSAGSYSLWKRSKYAFYSWMFFFIAITYVFSSWWMWYYGGSFSSRVYVEYVSFFSILLALFIQQIKSKGWYRFHMVLISSLILLCQVQTYQYRYYQIHWSDMTEERYWSNFLRVDKLIK
jgi:hypothetical protein